MSFIYKNLQDSTVCRTSSQSNSAIQTREKETQRSSTCQCAAVVLILVVCSVLCAGEKLCDGIGWWVCSRPSEWPPQQDPSESKTTHNPPLRPAETYELPFCSTHQPEDGKLETFILIFFQTTPVEIVFIISPQNRTMDNFTPVTSDQQLSLKMKDFRSLCHCKSL